MLFLVYLRTFLFCWSFSRNPFFAALLVRQSEEAEKFWSIMPPKEEEEKIVAFRAASFDEFLAIILPWQRKTFLRRL
jgi:hypothetical protein